MILRNDLHKDETATALELLTTAEMAAADQFAVASGLPALALMEAAGQAVANCALAMMDPPYREVVIVCGPGNNGGDGFVAARALRERGLEVQVGCLVDRHQLRGDAAAMARRFDGDVQPASNLSFDDAGLIIDAMYGAGLTRALDGAAADIAVTISRGSRGVPVLAVDVPSGLDGNTGDAPLMADGVTRGVAVQATRSITFFRPKPGHLLLPGRSLCGAIEVAGIGIPARALDEIKPRLFRNGPGLWREFCRSPEPGGHKYDRGHAVVVSGSQERTGAARLAARGALRSGAGLVTVASPAGAVSANAAHLTAIMIAPFEPPEGLSGIVADQRHNAILIGPGSGVTPSTARMAEIALASQADVVLDADAITIFKSDPDKLLAAMRRRRPDKISVVLTPHEGEFKRLFPQIVGSKLDRAKAAAKLSDAIVLLKGADTVIASPDGRAAINDNAPAALATAGSGDVLAGFVLGLLAQHWPAWEAACAAVWLHGECGRSFGPGLISEDLPEQLPSVLNRLLLV